MPRLDFCPLTVRNPGLLLALRRHLHLMGLSDSPSCWKCAAEDETSVHTLCEWEALPSLRHVYLGSFFLEQEDVKNTVVLITP